MHDNYNYAGGLVHLGEVEKAKDTLKLSESLYFRVFTQLFESKLLSLDAEASFHPQTMIQTNALFLAGIDDMLLADLFVRWKCISSELYALLIRLGVGSRFTSTFQRLEQLKLLGQGKSGQADVLAGLADQHQKEVGKVVQEWGPKVVTALSEVSCQQIQRVLDPEQIVMEYCMSALYDTKCHPVPIPPKFLAMSGVLIVIKAVGAPLVRVVDFDRIQKLALKAHDSAMKAVAAKRTRKPWHHLQSTADEVASALLEAMIPTDVQALLATPPMKRVFFCPDQLIAKFPVEILPFGNRLRFGEKCAVSYLSSAKELLRDSILSSLCPDLVKTSDPAGSDCIFFANPNFDLECQADAGALHPWSQLSTALASLFSKPVTASAPPLPHSETEVKEVEHLLSTAQGGKLRTQLFLKDESTLHQALKVQSPLILHFATHGFSSPEFQYQYQNFWSDTRSGLLLAGANTYHRGQFQDIASEAGTGELTALAACGMALQGTRLVYISTCRSTYGFIGRGEALSSLAQGFRSAGAHTVLATLWPVSDDIAQKLATHFYFFASKTGVHPSIALQNAKKKIREEGYDHWYDWAAFLCIGIDTPLFSSIM